MAPQKFEHYPCIINWKGQFTSTKKRHQIAPELKEQIISRIKNDGITIVQAAKDHGVNEGTICAWIAKKTEGKPNLSEILRLKREEHF